MEEYYKKAAKALSNPKPSSYYIKEAIKELIKPQKSEIFWWIVSVIISVPTAYIICFSYKTVVLTDTILNIFLGIQLALFGVVFTVFSIILAFFNDNMLKTLSRIEMENKDESYLTKNLSYYEKILFLYFINIIVTLMGIIIVKLTDENFVLISKTFSDISAFIVSLLYYLFSLKVLLEIKSMIYNTIMLFRANLSYKFVGFLQDSDEDK